MLGHDFDCGVHSSVDETNLHKHDTKEEEVSPNEEVLMIYKYLNSSIPIDSHIFCVVLHSKDIENVSNLLIHISCQLHQASACCHSYECLHQGLLFDIA